MLRPPPRRRRRFRPGRRGQSLVEFALLLPVLMILVLGAVDLGRLFYSWVTLNNSARVGANYAAANPNAKFNPATYASDVNAEGFGSLGGACTVSGGVPLPVFTDTTVDSNTTTKDLNDNATVTVSCTFHPITPIISSIVGSNLRLTASSTFAIRDGAFVP